ncbi:MAG: hypothetical protein ACI8Y7_000381 [Candidatus Woesearchaeota archaeon]|jgi:hypothetical protein
MMKKYITMMVIAIIALFALATSAYADQTIQNIFYESYYDIDNEHYATTNDLTNVNAFVVKCADGQCSSITDELFNGQSLNSGAQSQLTISYPTEQDGNEYIYGTYFYTDDHIVSEQIATFTGNNNVPHVQAVYLPYVEECNVLIDQFEVLNTVRPHEPIMIDFATSMDATAHSPLFHAGQLDYVPAQLAALYAVDANVLLEIIDLVTGNVVETQTLDFSIPYSESVNTHFEYTLTDLGRYQAVVTATATDSVCKTTVPMYSAYDFDVVLQNPTNLCYSGITNLQLTPTQPSVDEMIAVEFDVLSGYYDHFGGLSTQDTFAQVDIYYENTLVDSVTLVEPAVANIANPAHVAIDLLQPAVGFYDIVVTAQSNVCTTTNETVAVAQTSAQVHNNVTPNPVPNKAPVFSTLPSIVLPYNAGLVEDVFFVGDFAYDPDGDAITVSIDAGTRSDIVTCDLDNVANVDCTTQADQIGCSEFTITVLDRLNLAASQKFTACVSGPNSGTGSAPVVTIPDVVLDENEGQDVVALILSEHATDADGDQLSFSLVSQTQTDVVDCKIVADVLFCTTKNDQTGKSTITVSVSDGSHIVTDSFEVTVERALQKSTGKRGFMGTQLSVTQFRVTDLDSDLVDMPVFVKISNNGARVNDVKVVITIPELGARGTVGPFDVSGKGTVTRVVPLELDVPAQPGVYLVRMVISSENGQERIIHRDIRID